jgi:hypothetical protein
MRFIYSWFVLIKRAFLNLAYLDDHIKRITGLFEEQKKYIKIELRKLLLEREALNNMSIGVSGRNESKRVVVSLTTHGKRLHTVYRTIECIFQQTRKADKVVLWLGEEEYNENALPAILKSQQKRGLEVRFVKDIRSYTKILPALKEFPDDCIITIDDDIIYPPDLIERLMTTHEKNPDNVCCMALRRLELKTPHEFKPYRTNPLVMQVNNMNAISYIAEGFGGVLYPPHVFSEEVFRQEVFLEKAPFADDIWLKAMELLCNIELSPVGYEGYIWDVILVDEDVQDIGLSQENVYKDRNDSQLYSVVEYYNLFDRFSDVKT